MTSIDANDMPKVLVFCCDQFLEPKKKCVCVCFSFGYIISNNKQIADFLFLLHVLGDIMNINYLAKYFVLCLQQRCKFGYSPFKVLSFIDVLL